MWSLIIDDDPIHARLTSTMLQETMGEARIVPEGESGLRLLRRVAEGRREPPACVILDLRMPGMDGHQVLRQIQADDRLRAIPVIVLSGSRDPEDARRSRELGAAEHLRKPDDLDGYEATLRRIRAIARTPDGATLSRTPSGSGAPRA